MAQWTTYVVPVRAGIAQEHARYVTATLSEVGAGAMGGAWELVENARLTTDGEMQRRPGLLEGPPCSAADDGPMRLHGLDGYHLAQSQSAMETLSHVGARRTPLSRSPSRSIRRLLSLQEEVIPAIPMVATHVAVVRGGGYVVAAWGRTISVYDETTMLEVPSARIYDASSTAGYDLRLGASGTVLAIRGLTPFVTEYRVLDLSTLSWSAPATLPDTYHCCREMLSGWIVACTDAADIVLYQLSSTGAVIDSLVDSVVGADPAAVFGSGTEVLLLEDTSPHVREYTVGPLAFASRTALTTPAGGTYRGWDVRRVPGGPVRCWLVRDEKHTVITDLGLGVVTSLAWQVPVTEADDDGPGQSWWAAVGSAVPGSYDIATDVSASAQVLMQLDGADAYPAALSCYGETPYGQRAAVIGGGRPPPRARNHTPATQGVSALLRWQGKERAVGVVIAHEFGDDVPVGAGARCAGGLLTSGGRAGLWYGGEVGEQGCLATPVIHSAVPQMGVGLAPGLYRYQAVYERTEAGRLIRSPASPPVTATATPVNGHVRLVVRGHSASAVSGWRVVLYRSTADAPAGAPLHRLYEVDLPTDILVDDATWIRVDDTPDADIEDNEILYTTDGRLDTDPVPGGARWLTTWRDRVAAVGMERDDTVWLSQPIESGLAPEFSLGLQLALPGERLLACAALDDALIIFGAGGVWAAFGAGPAPSGDPQTGTWDVVPLAVPLLSDPMSLIEVPQGLMYRSTRGIELLDRSRAATWVGRPVQRLLTTASLITGAAYDPAHSEVHWLTIDRKRLVYHAVTGRWALWSHIVDGESIWIAGLAYSSDGVGRAVGTGAMIWMGIGGWTDLVARYALRARTHDLALQGQDLRLRSVRSVIARHQASGWVTRIVTDGDAGLPDEHAWTAADVTAIADPRGYAVLPAPAAFPACGHFSVEVEEQPGEDGAGVTFFGLELQLAMRAPRIRPGAEAR